MRDRDVVAAIVAGDPAGLAAAYDNYAPALHAYCRTLLAEPADAADAVQDAFVIAAAKLGALREPDRLRPWLYAVARNECHRRLRSRSRQADLDEAAGLTDEAADVAGTAERSELRGLVIDAIGGLNPGDREVIELNLRHDLDGADLAGALGVPLKQAHALASRARSQFERSLGALLVARTGRRQCTELDGMLAGWDGELTPLLRKRVSRHIENCEICGERKRRVLSPAMLLSIVPLVPVPPGLRHQVLRLVSDSTSQASTYRAHVLSRAGTFDAHGFPVQVAPPAPARWPGRRSGKGSVAASVGIVAALIFLGGGTVGVLLLIGGGGHHVSLAGPGVTPPASSPAGGTGPAGGPASPSLPTSPAAATAPAAAPGGGPGPAGLGPAASPEASGSLAPSSPPVTRRTPPPHPSSSTPPPSSPPPASGTLTETPATVVLQPAGSGGGAGSLGAGSFAAGSLGVVGSPGAAPSWEGETWSGTFTLTASGGPVSFSVTGPSPFTVSPDSGTIPSGESVTVTVSVIPTQDLPLLSTLTANPGGLSISVEFPDAAPSESSPPSSSYKHHGHDLALPASLRARLR